MSKDKKEQLQGCVSEVYFGYNTILEGYLQLTADINELGETAGLIKRGYNEQSKNKFQN